MKELKRKANSNLKTLKDLILAKEILLDKLKENIKKVGRHKERDKAMRETASSKRMRETSTRKQMSDQNTKGQYQQWINSLNFGQAYAKMRVKQPRKMDEINQRKYERENQASGRITNY